MIKIIGGAGFVGTHLKEKFSEYVILDKSFSNDEEIEKKHIYCDITKKYTLNGLIKKDDIIILLAAEHKDNVSPVKKYYETNVEGTQNVLDQMDKVGCRRLIFTSSVAVYGLNKKNPNENSIPDPFNHYGKSKLEAERRILSWYNKGKNEKQAIIIRPTVIFGPKNRGNVFNLLKQISSGFFIMIGKGVNKKSMVYVENVTDFISYISHKKNNELSIFNIVDKPDLSMFQLVSTVKNHLKLKIFSFKLPFLFGYLIGLLFDLLSFLTKIKFTVSSVRIKKFTATTQFCSKKIFDTGWKPPFTLHEGLKKTLDYEFVEERSENDEVFYTE